MSGKNWMAAGTIFIQEEIFQEIHFLILGTNAIMWMKMEPENRKAGFLSPQ